jgi:hypothetical protein
MPVFKITRLTLKTEEYEVEASSEGEAIDKMDIGECKLLDYRTSVSYEVEEV